MYPTYISFVFKGLRTGLVLYKSKSVLWLNGCKLSICPNAENKMMTYLQICCTFTGHQVCTLRLYVRVINGATTKAIVVQTMNDIILEAMHLNTLLTFVLEYFFEWVQQIVI